MTYTAEQTKNFICGQDRCFEIGLELEQAKKDLELKKQKRKLKKCKSNTIK